MILLDELLLMNGYIIDCALLLSFNILYDYRLYIIGIIFRRFSISGDGEAESVRIHLLVPDLDPERIVVEREILDEQAPIEQQNEKLYEELGKLILDKEGGVIEPESKKRRKKDFEFFSSEELEREAGKRIREQRKLTVESAHKILIPQTEKIVWGDKQVINKLAIIRKIVGYTPKINSYRDNTCMRDFLDQIRTDGIQDCRVGRWKEFMPNGAPVLDFLSLDATLSSGWTYPNPGVLRYYQENRALSLEMLRQVEVREIIVGKSTPEQVIECRKWIQKQYEVDQTVFPTKVIAMDVEEAKLSRYDELRLLGVIPITSKCQLAAQHLVKPDDRSISAEKDRWRQIPVRLMIGNGINSVLMITLDMEMSGRRYIIKKQVVSREILDLIRDIPVCTGLGVKSDVEDIEKFYSELSGEDVKMKGWIGLDAVAVVAGYRLQALGMTAMAAQLIGCIMNKCVSTGDGQWGRPWKDIKKGLKVYAIGDIKFAHMSYHILTAVLIRDIFPDPEVVCAFLGCFQSEGTTWFCEILLESVRELEVDGAVVKIAETRKDLVTALRGRTSTGVWTQGTPRRAWLWTRLFGNWPTVTNGGPRYLLQVREKFLDQVREIKAAKVKWSIDLELPEIGVEEKSHAVFGLTLTGAQWGLSEDTERVGMGREPTGSPPLLVINPEITTASEIARQCVLNGRSQKDAIMEWVRVYPELVGQFLTRMKKDEVFCSRFEKLYDPIRLSAWRSSGMEPDVLIDRLESELNQKGNDLVDHEYTQMIKAEELASAWRSRWLKLKNAREKGSAVLRAKWRHSLPSLPDWKPKTRRGKKRGRSHRSRSTSRGACPTRTSTLVRVDGANIDDDEVNEAVDEVPEVAEEDRKYLCDADGKNQLTGLGRSSAGRKKRKGSRGTILRTYDEMIESKPVYSSDEYDLELFINDE